MTDPMFPNIRRLHQFWTAAMINLAWTHWTFLNAGLRLAHRMWEPTGAAPGGGGSGPPPPAEAAPQKASGEAEDLARRAADRMGKGLAPPPEVYQAPWRSRLDWSKFPEWARPTDPDLFEGSCHEG